QFLGLLEAWGFEAVTEPGSKAKDQDVRIFQHPKFRKGDWEACLAMKRLEQGGEAKGDEGGKEEQVQVTGEDSRERRAPEVPRRSEREEGEEVQLVFDEARLCLPRPQPHARSVTPPDQAAAAPSAGYVVPSPRTKGPPARARGTKRRSPRADKAPRGSKRQRKRAPSGGLEGILGSRLQALQGDEDPPGAPEHRHAAGPWGATAYDAPSTSDAAQMIRYFRTQRVRLDADVAAWQQGDLCPAQRWVQQSSATMEERLAETARTRGRLSELVGTWTVPPRKQVAVTAADDDEVRRATEDVVAAAVAALRRSETKPRMPQCQGRSRHAGGCAIPPSRPSPALASPASSLSSRLDAVTRDFLERSRKRMMRTALPPLPYDGRALALSPTALAQPSLMPSMSLDSAAAAFALSRTALPPPPLMQSTSLGLAAAAAAAATRRAAPSSRMPMSSLESAMDAAHARLAAMAGGDFDARARTLTLGRGLGGTAADFASWMHA
ncbi:hypothetical protein ACHAWF_003685, partial [Thalassiosira exigua]